jgi:hypothetical protein
LSAFIHVVLGLLQVVRNVNELARAVEILDRKDATKDRLEPDFLSLAWSDIGLEKLIVTAFLDINKIRDLDDRLNTAEIRTIPEVGLDLRRHFVPPDDSTREQPKWPLPRAAQRIKLDL